MNEPVGKIAGISGDKLQELEAAALMASVNVVTASQLESIRQKVATPLPTDKSQRLKELHELSQTRAAGWSNTLKAQRERKERMRAEREAADEMHRQKADAEAAAEKAAQRQEVIERVNKLLFSDTDKVKSFHGSVLHCDVLAERAAQLEFSAHTRAQRAAQDAAFARQQREQLELADRAEVARAAETKAAAEAQRDAQLAQLEEVKAGIRAERDAARQEGEMVRAKAAQEAADLKTAEAAAQRRAQAALAETTKANEALKEFKAAEAAREAAADAAVERYAATKAEELAERRRREAARAAEKERKRAAMVELMETKFKEFMSNENERLERDVQQAEAKNAAELAERARRRRDEWAAICKSRSAQLAARGAAKEEQARADAAMMAAWQERTKELEQEERDEAAARRARNKHYASFQKHQAGLRAQKKEAGKLQALQEAAMLQDMAHDADDRYKRYAQEFINEYTKQGKPVEPMVLTLNRKEPFTTA